MYVSIVRRVRAGAYRVGIVTDGNKSLATRVERLIHDETQPWREHADAPALAVIVRLSDGSRLERYMGNADIESRRPLDPSTAFQAMSISKPFTAMLVVKLAEQGLLDLDVPVTRYLTSWRLPPERCAPGCDFEQITLRRLLSHTAGLNLHGFGWSPARAGHPFGTCRPRPIELLEGICGEPLRLVAPPGSANVYSGGGYALVEAIVEEVRTQRFAETAKEVLLKPLGMDGSDAHQTDDVLARLATRYLPSAATPGHPDTPWGPLAAAPRLVISSTAASGLYSTPHDLCAFMEALMPVESAAAPYLSREGARAMFTPQFPADGERTVGLGFHLWLKRSDTIFAHRGYTDGWWSEVIGFARRRCFVVVMTNADLHERYAKPLTVKIRQCVLDHAI